MIAHSPSVGASKGPGRVGAPARSLSASDFQMVAEAIPHIVWMAAPDGATTYFNQQGCEYTGCPRQANDGWGWVALLHPDDAEAGRLAWEHRRERRIRSRSSSASAASMAPSGGTAFAPCHSAMPMGNSRPGSVPPPTSKTSGNWNCRCAARNRTPSKPSPSYNRSSRLLPGGSASSTGTFASVASTRASLGWVASRSKSTWGAPWPSWCPPYGPRSRTPTSGHCRGRPWSIWR